ncbi:N-acetylglucosamine kinase-like BadF-type ATPase [Pontibacter aydingkolensis]|uniref:DUF4168 domain-containing protein n=1 Tax=Pontibacter aydingkolensis TaxID=1911536 RepID=A0ABS7CQI7_9BACT|nr:DUF4168 domain-containing protein [Pontibacter aydingkolensis]MBW7466106.1 DUF4168 domain-containing protein [Pontibacter aydingkolensis]
MNILNRKVKGIAVAILFLGVCAVTDTAVAQKKDKKQKTQQTETQTQSPQMQQQTQQSGNFSDGDLKQFADASSRLMVIQQNGEQKMLKILEEEKLSVDKFNEMAQAHQQQKLSEVGATVEETAAFNKAAQRMMELQPEMQKEVETAIQKDGMTLEKYEQIMIAYRQDPALQEKINKLMTQE